MPQNSQQATRTSLAMRNASLSILCYLLPLIAAFFARRYFIEVLGAELLGLNNVVLNILNVLNTSELGLSSAIAFALYEPLYKGDRTTATQIVTLQARIYRWIARFILVASIILLFFFPYLFAKVHLPLWYAYATYGVMLVSTLLSYYFNYRQVLFSSDQRAYIPNLCINSNKLLKLLLQTVCIIYCSHGYLWWLGWELFFAFTLTGTLEYLIRKRYPWLQLSREPIGKLLKMYPKIVKRTKQLIFHRVSAMLLQQGVTLVIYGILGAIVVTEYNNYTTLYLGLSTLVSFVFYNLQGGIGNKIVECREEGIGNGVVERLFRQLFSLRMYVSAICITSLYLLAPSFIALWVGQDMLFDNYAFFLSLLYIFLLLNRAPDDFIAAYGMYQDIWAPVIEMTLNIALSIILGLIWGLPGIFAGVIISLVIVVHGWKPFFLYRKGFEMSPTRYLSLLLPNLGLVIFSLALSGWLFSAPLQESWGSFVLFALGRGMGIGAITTVLFALFSRPFRDGISKVYTTLRKKG
ncbi:MAG: sugar transporter [Porphyromonas sp.]|nr:sugar transporter [Porphyromonas sp.]